MPIPGSTNPSCVDSGASGKVRRSGGCCSGHAERLAYRGRNPEAGADRDEGAQASTWGCQSAADSSKRINNTTTASCSRCPRRVGCPRSTQPGAITGLLRRERARLLAVRAAVLGSDLSADPRSILSSVSSSASRLGKPTFRGATALGLTAVPCAARRWLLSSYPAIRAFDRYSAAAITGQ
jgi:hypothetical protein